MLRKEIHLDVVEYQDVISEFSNPSRWKELSKETGSEILPSGDGSRGKTIREEQPTLFPNGSSWCIESLVACIKKPTGTTPYKLIYGKKFHLPFEIEHRAYWELENCNPDLIIAGEKRMFQLHELDEVRHQAYENSRLYKARTKVRHDRKLRMRKEFKYGNKVELYGKDGKTFIVNGHRIKLYHEEEDYNDQREAVTPFFPKE
ncbi:hypothetical protein Tco_0008880 [Tanacetum coccineum]